MKHIFEQKVFHADTDAYGHVWHGTYFRWMEMGRVLFCEDLGYNLSSLMEQDIVLPVVNINISYKSSAKLGDNLIVETFISDYNPLSITFKQVIKDSESEKIFINADVVVVAVNNDGKLYRRMPKMLFEKFEKVCVK